MSHIHTKKLLTERKAFANHDWWYDFQKLPELATENSVQERSKSLLQAFSNLTKRWDSDLNSEWTIRIYFSSKMVLVASVMAQSLRYAEENNLRPVISYLSYYTVLHSLRAILFTSPQVEWKNGEILKATHSKTINIACDAIARFNKGISEHVKKSTLHLKAFRELISYRAPSSGDNVEKPDFDIYENCRFFLEIAQLQSELLETSLKESSARPFELNQDFMRHAYETVSDGIHFTDIEDQYRIGYLARKHPKPTNILHMMSEGHVEDFFGSWCAPEEMPNSFNPDNDWRILFDVP